MNNVSKTPIDELEWVTSTSFTQDFIKNCNENSNFECRLQPNISYHD